MSKPRTLMPVALGLVLALTALPALLGGEPARPEPLTPAEARPAAEKPAADSAVATLKLAHELARWGRRNENPAALALASRMLRSVTIVPMKKGLKVKKPGASKTGEPAKKKRPEDTAESLMAEAKAMCAGNKAHLAALSAIGRMGKQRGPVGGAARHTDIIMRYDTDTYRIVFRGGETAEMAVFGDGDTDLDLYVYDDKANLIVSATGGPDGCRVRWVPKSTGAYVVKIKNRGGLPNHYTFVTN